MGQKYIAINIAGDMIPIRFPGNGKDYIDYETFKNEMVKLIVDIVEKQSLNIVFIPHIYKDLEIIADLLNNIPDSLRRTRVAVAPYLTGFAGQDYIFDLYKNAELVLGNRFHTNVCAIGLNVPTIGLSNYPKVLELYSELNISERCVEINRKGFSENTLSLTNESLAKSENINIKYKLIVEDLKKELVAFHHTMYDLIENY